jgi:4-hydroxybenzoate polyprenyltransferase
MFLDNPLGVGGNNFQVRFEEYQTQWFKRGMYGRVSHSLWFTLLPELGVLGVMIYLLIIKCNTGDLIKIKDISKKLSSEKSILLSYMVTAFFASLAGFLVSATFLSVLYYSHYWYLTALIAATAKISRECLEIEKRATNQNVETLIPD